MVVDTSVTTEPIILTTPEVSVMESVSKGFPGTDRVLVIVVTPETVEVENIVNNDVLVIVVDSVNAAESAEVRSSTDEGAMKVDVRVTTGTVVMVNVPDTEVVPTVLKMKLVGWKPDKRHEQALLTLDAGIVVSMEGMDIVSRRSIAVLFATNIGQSLS